MADNNNDKEYDLYTEHIVKDPWKKIARRAKKILLIMCLAVFFGLVAGLIMLLVYKVGKDYIEDDKNQTIEKESESVSEIESDTESKEPVTISPVETEPAETEPVTEIQIDDEVLKEYAGYYKSIQAVASKVKESMVTVTVTKENIDWFNATYQNISEAYGLVISADSTGYYILTDYSLVKSSGDIVITYPGGGNDTAVLLAGDATTNLAVIKTSTFYEDEVNIAAIGDSNAVLQGDFVLAVGKLYGFGGSIGYGLATGINNSVSDTDSVYPLINTDIVGSGNPTGVLCNLRGEITGIITTAYNSGNSNLITAYAVKDIVSLVESLSNGKTTPYLGIRGQEVTPQIKDKYNIPDGIYITAVETNSPAYQAGIQTGDVLYAINNIGMVSMNGFMKELGKYRPEDKISVMVKRKGRDEYKEIEFNLFLGVE